MNDPPSSCDNVEFSTGTVYLIVHCLLIFVRYLNHKSSKDQNIIYNHLSSFKKNVKAFKLTVKRTDSAQTVKNGYI